MISFIRTRSTICPAPSFPPFPSRHFANLSSKGAKISSSTFLEFNRTCPNTKHYPLLPREREEHTFHPAIQFLLPHFFSFLSFLLLLFSTAFNRGTMRTRLFLDLLSRAASPRGESHGLYRECLQGLSSHPSQWSVPVTYVPCLYRPCSDPGIPRTRGCNTYAAHLSSPSPPLSLSLSSLRRKRILANFINARRNSRFEG